LEFSRTRAHYLVFKEQVFGSLIITKCLPLSRGLFAFRERPPRAAPAFVTDPLKPVKHLFGLFFPFPAPSLSYLPAPMLKQIILPYPNSNASPFLIKKSGQFPVPSFPFSVFRRGTACRARLSLASPWSLALIVIC